MLPLSRIKIHNRCVTMPWPKYSRWTGIHRIIFLDDIVDEIIDEIDDEKPEE